MFFLTFVKPNPAWPILEFNQASPESPRTRAPPPLAVPSSFAVRRLPAPPATSHQPPQRVIFQPSWSAAPTNLPGRGGSSNSQEDGVEGGGEAHQALEDPPRRQRNLPRSPLQSTSPTQSYFLLVARSPRSPFTFWLPGDDHQRQGQGGVRAHQAGYSVAESRHRRGQEPGNMLLHVRSQLFSPSVESM